MKNFNWKIFVGILLVILSIALYILHWVLFRDSHHIFIFMLGDLAFVPVEVLFVTLIIDQALKERERKQKLEKMNMAVGVFFNSMGMKLIEFFARLDSNLDKIEKQFVKLEDWEDKEFDEHKKTVKKCQYKIDIKKEDLNRLYSCMKKERNLLLGLLENPNLLEHETFTDLLWAVFHLEDELAHRKDLNNIPDSDLEHILIDIERAYILLIQEWIAYMKHLKHQYPYLFSLAVRTNPFNANAKVEVVK